MACTLSAYASLRRLVAEAELVSPPTLAGRLSEALGASITVSLGDPMDAADIPQCAVVWTGRSIFASGVYIGGGRALSAFHVLNVSNISVAVAKADNSAARIALTCDPIAPDDTNSDIAVLRMDPRDIPPNAAPAIPLATGAQFNQLLQTGATVTVVGFGCALAADGSCMSGVKNQIQISMLPPSMGAGIQGFDPRFYFVAGDASRTGPFHATCTSDSGGPAFATIDRVLTLVGITHGGENALATTPRYCGAYRRSVFSRVDVCRDWILSADCGQRLKRT
jgi:secreted trypsin-like serine protease